MIKHKNLTLVDVIKEDARITFKMLDENAGKVYTVKWTTMGYDQANREWIEDQNVENRVQNWAQTYFGVALDEVENLIDLATLDVYEYENFCSFWKSDAKFKPEMKGKTFDATIESIEENPSIGILVKYNIDDETYCSKYNYTEWLKRLNKGFLNDEKIKKARERFANLFGVNYSDDLSQFKGRTIKVKVKAAGKSLYGEIVAVL